MLSKEEFTMPRLRSENVLETLEAQREALELKIKKVAAYEKTKKAAEDNRRWQLAGKAAVEHMQADPSGSFCKTMMSLLDHHARSASDRKLFGLRSKASNGGNGEEDSASLLP
jgi:hypothetical protein